MHLLCSRHSLDAGIRRWRNTAEDEVDSLGNQKPKVWSPSPSRLLDYAFVCLVGQVKKKILQGSYLYLEGIFLYSNTGDSKVFAPDCCYVLGIVFCVQQVLSDLFLSVTTQGLYFVHFKEEEVKAQRARVIHAKVISEAEL